MSFVVVKPLILVLCSQRQLPHTNQIRLAMTRLGALHTVIVAEQVRQRIDQVEHYETPSIETVAAWATKADGIMVYPEVVETTPGRAVARACREAASRPSARWPHGRSEDSLKVPVLHLGADIGSDRVAAWIDTWTAQNQPTALVQARARLQARTASTRTDADLPFAWTASDELVLRNVKTGELGPAIHLDLSVCRDGGDGALDRADLQHRVASVFDAFHAAETRREAVREGAGI